MLEVTDILSEEGQRGVKIWQKTIDPYTATGKTKKSAYYKIEGRDTTTSIEILAREFVDVLQTGSKPAKTRVPSKEMIDSLTPWAKSRGIPEEAIYPIAVKLLKEGQKVNRNVWKEQMEKWADEVVDRILNDLAGFVVDQVVNKLAA